MQWLNKFDDALESALKPRRNQDQQQPQPPQHPQQQQQQPPPKEGEEPSEEPPSGRSEQDVDAYRYGSSFTKRQDAAASGAAAHPLHQSDDGTLSGTSGVRRQGENGRATASSTSSPANIPPLPRSAASSTPRSLPGSLVKKTKMAASKRSRAASSELPSFESAEPPRRPASDQKLPSSTPAFAPQQPPQPPSRASSEGDRDAFMMRKNVITASTAASTTPVAASATTTPRGRGPPGRIRKVPTPTVKATAKTKSPTPPKTALTTSAHRASKTKQAADAVSVHDSSGNLDENDDDDAVKRPESSPTGQQRNGYEHRSLLGEMVSPVRTAPPIDPFHATPGHQVKRTSDGIADNHPGRRIQGVGRRRNPEPPAINDDDDDDDDDDGEMRDVDLGEDATEPVSKRNGTSDDSQQFSNRSRTEGDDEEEDGSDDESEPARVLFAATRPQPSTSGNTSGHSEQRADAPATSSNHRNASVRVDDESARSFPTSLPRQVEFKSEFDVGDVVQGWISEEGAADEPFDAQRNCYGVVRVRPIRAQRLSCSVGTAVHAVVSLQPWDGKIRTRSTQAFAADKKRHGVCVQWEQDEREEKDEDEPGDGDDLSHAPVVSMVHAYSGEETPVPRVRVDLVFKLVFEFTVASFEVPCQELMANPSVPRRQWFAAVAGVKHQASDQTPLLELEAVFEPAETASSKEQQLALAEPKRDATKGADDGLPVDSIDVGSVASSLKEELVTLPTPSIRASQHSQSKLVYNVPYRDETDGVSLSQHSLARGDGRPIATTPHMLRVTSHWTPAVCCVCKRSIMSGITKTRAYHCEVCRVDCCGDCRLQVDVQLPCGSEAAARARDDVIQNRFTVENIINTVAPPAVANGEEDPSAEDDSTSELHEARRGTSLVSLSNKAPIPSFPIDKSGIGTMSLVFVRALVFERPLPADSEPDASQNSTPVKKGDYYIRVTPSSGEGAKRTRTMQNTGRPKFDSGEIKFSVPHYGTEFRIELVDASTNGPLGAGVITTQSLLLRQRDAFVEKHGLPLLFPFRGPPSYDAQPIRLELRVGVKSGADFFSFTKVTSKAAGNKAKSGDIVGTIDLSAKMEERFDNLFGPAPYECPAPPAAELNMAMFGMHLARLLGLIDDARRIFQVYLYVVSWRNPFITGGSLVLYVYSCIKFDAEYLGNLPIACILVWMLQLAFARWRGRLRKRLLDKEEEQLNKSLAVTIDRSLHRPAGKITVAVKAGKNLRSADLGLPGLVGVRVLWDPTRYLSNKVQRVIPSLDKTAAAAHEVGSTNYLYTTNPTFARIDASDVSKRLKHLLPTDEDGGFFPDDKPSSEGTVTFPILQPVSLPPHSEIPVIDPWSASPGAIVFEVNFQDTISLLPGSVYVLGEVVVPLANLTKHGLISGWFQVLEAGSTRVVALGAGPDSSDAPQIHIHVAWTPPSSHPDGYSDTEREASFVIQEEMARSAVASKETKLGLVGSSIGAINTVRGLSDNLLLVQNALGLILDTIGSIRNAFNFADPFRSSVVFWVVVLLWLLLRVIPTRFVMLMAGVIPYVAMFISRFGFLFKRASSIAKVKQDKSVEDASGESSPVATWMANAFRGLPTDEDVRKTYFWECRRYAVRKHSEAAESKRNARLRRLWRAQFYSTVCLFALKDDGRSVTRSPVFCIIQGHRFLWWHSVEGFDAGEEPIGLIFLSGHAGLATPSPLELRHLEKNDLTRVVSIFGRGRDAQVRVTLIAPSEDVRTKLEYAIAFATSEKRD